MNQSTIISFFKPKKNNDSLREIFQREYEKEKEVRECESLLCERCIFNEKRCEEFKLEIEQLKTEKSEVTHKYTKLKNKQIELLQTMFSMEKRIQKLSIQVDDMNEKKTNAEQNNEHSEHNASTHFLTKEDLLKLNSVSNLKKADATFIRFLLEILYKDDLRVLINRSVTGKLKKTVTSNEISPEKKGVIVSLFNNRIENSSAPIREQLERIKSQNVNVLIKTGINNIRTRIHKPIAKQ